MAEDEWPLLIGWIAQAMRPAGPYIHLGLIGEQGTGKSTLARMLKHLIDPCKAEVRVAPRESRDLIIGATRNALLVYDNMGRIDNWLADVLCILATGGGQGGRKYFTDDDETVHEAQRPVILTSITDVMSGSTVFAGGGSTIAVTLTGDPGPLTPGGLPETLDGFLDQWAEVRGATGTTFGTGVFFVGVAGAGAPEPSGLLMLGLGAGGVAMLGYTARRRARPRA